MSEELKNHLEQEEEEEEENNRFSTINSLCPVPNSLSYSNLQNISASCSPPPSMAATTTFFSRYLTKTTASELARTIRTTAPVHLLRFSSKSTINALSSSDELAQGPSCLFVGPIDTASKETLEALYLQVRD